LPMLTKEEQTFVDYWQVQRTRERTTGLRTGFRLGVVIVLLTFISIIIGWHRQALSALRSDYSTILVIVIAALGIVIFMSVFASRYQWEQREQRYKELRQKKGSNE
jgi:Mg/Co/Ni transporter MgtE